MFDILSVDKSIFAEMQKLNIWRKDCPVSRDRLKIVDFSYYNFQQQVEHGGQIMIFDVLAESLMKIMQELFALKFPISKARLMNFYRGDDELAMEDNNSSGFNFRYIKGTKKISMHGLGMAVDINPLQNPFIVKDEKTQKTVIYPEGGKSFLDRSNVRSGMVEHIVPLLYKHGFKIWGGSWSSPIDYHHFQLDRNFAEELLSNSYAKGKQMLHHLPL